MKTQEFTPITALGLMSGTSKDGVDVVKITTDGAGYVRFEGHYAMAYPRPLYERLKACASTDVPLTEVLRLEHEVTLQYVQAIKQSGLLTPDVRLMGCHGQTIRHLPAEGLTWQLADASLLAEHTGVPVVADFRRRDMAAGGQGAPLVPLFHRAIVPMQLGVCGVLNIGGVANVTVLDDAQVYATDCGPGMGLLDQFVQVRTGKMFDEDGALATSGRVVQNVINRVHELPFFARSFPKSADRYEFNSMLDWLKHASDADGAATLAALTVEGIVSSVKALVPQGKTLQAFYLCGGGPRNKAVSAGLVAAGLPVRTVEDLGWPALAVEAACFAWLSVRRLRGLPLSLPGTTGAKTPTVGGVLTA
jgi:anhydro-N-acetylmuramic acid kinase